MKTKDEKKYGEWINMEDIPTTFLYSPIEFVKLNPDRTVNGEINVISKNDFKNNDPNSENITIARIMKAGATHWRYLSSNKRELIVKELKKQGLIK